MLVLSYIVAYIVDPILDFLQKKKHSRALGVFIIILSIILIATIFLFIVAPYFIKEVLVLGEKIPDILNFFKLQFSNVVNFLTQKFPDFKLNFSNDKVFSMITGENIQKFLSGFANTVLAGYSYTMTLFNLFLFPVFAFYFCIDFDKINKGFINLVPRQYRRGLNTLLIDIDASISSYLRGQLLICCLMAILYAIGLLIVGVDLWLVIAIISGFANLIPYLGVAIGIIFAVIMALVSGGGWMMILGVGIVFSIVSFLESMFITPKIQGKNIGLSPLAIMLALIAGANVLGIFGMLIAIPVLSALKITFTYYYDYAISKTFPYKD